MSKKNNNNPEPDKPEDDDENEPILPEGVSKEDLAAELEKVQQEHLEDSEKFEEIVDRAASWATGEAAMLEQAGYNYQQALMMVFLRQERILLELLHEIRHQNGKF